MTSGQQTGAGSGARNYQEIEGLRAFLALAVAIAHSYGVLKISGNAELWKLPPFGKLVTFDERLVRVILFFAEGTGAVLTFFAISGFVLAHALSQRAEKLYPKSAPAGRELADQYYYLGLQRFFRLFPLHWVVLLGVICMFPLLPRPDLAFAAEWYAFYELPEGWREWLLNAFFLSNSLNPPAWSLFHETWPLVAFPLLLFAVDRAGGFGSKMLLVLMIFVAGHMSQVAMDGNWLRNPFLFVSLFIGGAVLYRHQGLLRRMTLGPPLLYWIGMSSIRLMSEEYQDSYVLMWLSLFSFLVLAAVIAVPQGSLTARLLRSRPMVWLGTRSYGFYITHFPVNYGLGTLILAKAPPAMLQDHAVLLSTALMAGSIALTALVCEVAAHPFETYWQRVRQRVTGRSGPSLKTKKGIFSAVAAALALAAVLGLSMLTPAATGHEDRGVRLETISVDGTPRQYALTLPGIAKRPLPLVIYLHGYHNTVDFAKDYIGLDKVARREGFAVAYPAGRNYLWNVMPAETAAQFPEQARAAAADVAFIEALADDLVRRGIADPQRLYLAGISNGGRMTYLVACGGTTRFAAAAALIAPLPDLLAKHCRPKPPLPMLLMGATDDAIFNWNGEAAEDPARSNLSLPGTAAYWRRVNGCTGRPEVKRFAEKQPDDPSSVSMETWRCRQGAKLAFFTIANGGHQPSTLGATIESPNRTLGVRNRDLETAEEMWRFFSGFSRR